MFHRILLVLSSFAAVGCGNQGTSLTHDIPNPFEPAKVAEFSLSPYYPGCVVGNCWHDYVVFEGTRGMHQVRFEEGDYGAKTGGELYFECKDGSKVSFDVPTAIAPGWTSDWLENPCRGPIRKITMKAGLDGTWGGGRLSYWRKWF